MDRFDYTDGDFCMDMGGGMMMAYDAGYGWRNGNGYGIW